MEIRALAPHERNETANRLVEATISLVGERGVAGTGVAEICKRAGVVKTALYYHFGSKDGLMRAVIEDIKRGTLLEVLGTVESAAGPSERLDRLIEGLEKLVEDRGDLLLAKQGLIHEIDTLHPEVGTALRQTHDDAIAAVSRGFTNTLGEGIVDVDLLAQTVIALLYGALRRQRIHPDEDRSRLYQDMKRTVRTLVADRIAEAMS